MSVAVSSSIGQLNYKPPYIKSGNNFFKNGAIYLNGKKVFIGGSLEQTARKINRQKAVTGIKAEVKDKRLVLLSKKTIVNIRDTKHFKDQGQELLSISKAEIIQAVVSGLKNSNMSFEEIQENQGKISDHVKLFMMQCANPVRLNFVRNGKVRLEISNSSKLENLVAGLTLDKLRDKPASLSPVFLKLNKKTKAIVKSFSSNEQFLKFDALCRALSAYRPSLVKIGNFVAVRDFERALMQQDRKSTNYKMGDLIAEFKTSRATIGVANIAQVISNPQNIAIILWTYMTYSKSPTLLADYNISKNDISRMLA